MVGENIRRVRNDKKISINKLSKLSGVALGFLSDIENGKTNPSIPTLTKIAKVLDVPVSEFFRGEPFKPLRPINLDEVVEHSDKVTEAIIEALKTATEDQKKKILDIIGIIKKE